MGRVRLLSLRNLLPKVEGKGREGKGEREIGSEALGRNGKIANYLVLFFSPCRVLSVRIPYGQLCNASLHHLGRFSVVLNPQVEN